MRDQLRRTNWHVYGLSEEDFDYTVNIVEQLIKSRIVGINQETEHLEDDPADDLIYYAWLETQYLWHFCLWRLQGVFEGIITRQFLKIEPDEKLLGLKAKLNAMRSAGFSVPQGTYEELLLWANLRNALSHSPPERFRPIEIEKGDMEDYLQLVKTTLATWRRELSRK